MKRIEKDILMTGSQEVVGSNPIFSTLKKDFQEIEGLFF
jgi:hypothetical protein